MEQKLVLVKEPADATSAAAWTCVAQLNDLIGDGPFALAARGLDIAVIRTSTGLRAYQGRCPHQGALLGEGEREGDALVCRNHRWRFNAETGRRQGGPQCLVSCPIRVVHGEVLVDTTPLEQANAASEGSSPRRGIAELPGPAGLPVVGNLLQLDRPRFHLVLEEWARRYGTVFKYRMGPRTIVVISDPVLSEQVLRARPEDYRRASPVEPVFAEMGVAGVFSAEGAEWRPQRRLAMEALAHRNLRGFYPALAVVARRLHERWQHKADAGATLDVSDELKRFTVDVTTMLAFGYDVNTVEQGDDVIQRQLELVFPALHRRLFAVLPTWRWWRTPSDRRLDRALGELRAWLGGRIADARARMATREGGASRPENFLESMIAARDAEGRPFPDEVIFGNAMTMLLAGEDTTAYTLAWAVYHLCSTAGAVAELRAEADAMFADGVVAPDIETADGLSYAAAVANEAMRLRPVAPLLYVESNRDVVVGDLSLPRGTWMTLLTRPPATDAANFADPEAFRPDRWLPPPGHERAHEPSAHIPFGSGPRICPGRSLGVLEMKVVLSMLYRNFDVEPVGDPARVREIFAFTMMPDGVRVRLHRRSMVRNSP